MEDEPILRIHPDFNTMNMDDQERVLLPTHFDKGLLVHLKPGALVELWEPFDFEVLATVEHDDVGDRWYARPDWSTQRNLQSIELKRFWALACDRDEIEKAASATREVAVLEQRAREAWHALTTEERDYLKSLPQFARYC